MPQLSSAHGLLALAFVLPWLSCAIHALFPQRSPRGYVASLCLLLAFLLHLIGGWSLDHMPFSFQLAWIDLPSFHISFSLSMGYREWVMNSYVLGISTLAHVYSVFYMRGRKGLSRYYALLGLFSGSMGAFVIADNLLWIFVFWELMGFCSYFLIAFSYQEKSHTAAASKAFLLGKVGDMGFLLGIVLLWTYTATLDLSALRGLAQEGPEGFYAWWGLSLCGYAFVWSALSKSAQLPFSTWLADAMCAPQPVSALLHSATLVSAGIWLLAKLFFLFPSVVIDSLLWIGLLSALGGAASALAQRQVKQLLAYSTISHFGFAMMLLGLQAPSYALFYLLAHAVFKSLLFLSTGLIPTKAWPHESPAPTSTPTPSSISEIHKTRQLWPYLACIVGTCALAGLPFTVGGMGKDLLITAFLAHAPEGYGVLLGLALILSALYAARLLAYLLRAAVSRTPPNQSNKQPNKHLYFAYLPLGLGALACVSLFYTSPTVFPAYHSSWLYALLHEKAAFIPHPHMPSPRFWALAPLSSIGFGAGLLFFWRRYKRRPLGQTTRLRLYFEKHFYLHQGYEKLCQGTVATSLGVQALEKGGVQATTRALGRGVVIVSWLIRGLDKHLVERVWLSTAGLLYGSGRYLAHIPYGHLQRWVYWSIAFILSIIVLLMMFAA